MWPRGSEGLGQASSWDVGFTEAISKRMQVPDRLKVAGADDPLSCRGPGRKPPGDALPPALLMHVPDRLLLAEVTDSPSRPLLEKRLARDWPWAPAAFGDPPFLSLASRPGPQKCKRPVLLGRVQKERNRAEDPLLGVVGPRHSWRDPSSPPPAPSRQCPPFPLAGRIYTLRNSLRALHFLGLWLFRLLWAPGQGAPLSPQDLGLAMEGPLEELSATEMLAMRRQLAGIAGRLRRLEEQHMGWRQKELLVYSVLLSVCLLDLWLWLRR